MPPQGRGRGGGTGGGAGRAGSAASADPGAGPSTSGCSGPASQLSLLPVPLLRAYRALPAAAEALLPAPVTQRPGGGGSAAGRGRGAGSGRLVALREGKEHLSTLDRELKSLPYPRPPQQAAAVAELLSTHPAETAALLRLYSAALRPGGEGEGSGGGGSGSGSGGSGGSMLGTSDLAEGWQANTAYPVYAFLRNCSPLTTCPHALSVLRFVLALLRAQTLPALSRRLAAAATNAAAGSSGGAGRAILQHSIMLIDKLHSATMSDGLLSDALPADVLSLRLSQTSGPCNTAALMVAALRRGRVLLTQQASSAGLVERRRGWWRLAASAAVYGMWDDGHNWYHLWQLWELATEPLMAMWPDGRLDLDTLPPASPPEVAAALAAGLLPALAASPDRPRSGPAEPRGSSKRLRGPFDDLLTACSGARPGDPGFALFLAPLLAYGEPGQAEGLLGALGRGLEAERGGGTGGSADFKPLLRAATSLLGALAGALQRCRRLGPAAGDALEGPVEVAAGEKGVVMESLDRGTCGATAEAAAAEGSGAWEVPGAEAGTCAAGAAVAEAAEGSGAGEAPAAAAAEGSGAGEAPAAAAAEGSGAGEAPGAEAGTCTDGKSSGAVPHEADGAREALSTDGGSGAAGEPFSAGPLWPPLQQLRRLAAYASELWGMPLPAQPAAVREEGEASA
ncbi:hypothetical protein HYH03_003819 [Edaphochlamys debaryana]|uniref:Uncharacterized protein n=1 Tax=Edaphochlamys debaryana TaxID=47281 RepID=A0A836C3Q4_9CHLO|nr:hypothetical protein HYH03_003819 [Edaphochlamys debaryana]|eukprot:KAG2498058.1 hypothetical protein HYH03_003819 [Edaphochlamys debaryana]